MSEDVMRQHIDLYVNDYSLGLGHEGKQAISVLHEVFNSLNPGKPNHSSSDLFHM
jgi:1,4-dihydroxy-6-naphthoate synthase